MGYFDYLFNYEWELTKSDAGANQWKPVDMPDDAKPVNASDPSKPQNRLMNQDHSTVLLRTSFYCSG